MKRKIVRHGSSSLTVTLPIKWVEKYKLKKGDELSLEESGPLLMISTEKETASPKKELFVSETDLFTRNNLSHLYHLGYDEIEIGFEDAKTLKEIKERLPLCMGFEIIEQRRNKVLIKSIAAAIESEFDTLLRKSFHVTNDMAKSLLEAMANHDYSHLSEIREMEAMNNKFTDICIRILNKRGYKNPRRTMQMYEIVKNLERIADSFKYIADVVIGYNKKLDKSAVTDFKKAVDYYLAFSEMFYTPDTKLKKKIYVERKQLLLDYNEKLKQSRNVNSLLYHHYIELIQKTYDGAGGYFALVL